MRCISSGMWCVGRWGWGVCIRLFLCVGGQGRWSVGAGLRSSTLRTNGRIHWYILTILPIQIRSIPNIALIMNKIWRGGSVHVSGAVILVTYIAMMIVCSGRGGHLLPVRSRSQDRRSRCRVPAGGAGVTVSIGVRGVMARGWHSRVWSAQPHVWMSVCGICG